MKRIRRLGALLFAGTIVGGSVAAQDCASVIRQFSEIEYERMNESQQISTTRDACRKLSGDAGPAIAAYTGGVPTSAPFNYSDCDNRINNSNYRREVIRIYTRLHWGAALIAYQTCMNATNRDAAGFHVWYESRPDLGAGAFILKMRVNPPFNCREGRQVSGKTQYECQNTGIIEMDVQGSGAGARAHACRTHGQAQGQDPFDKYNNRLLPRNGEITITCVPHGFGPWVISFRKAPDENRVVPPINPIIIPGK